MAELTDILRASGRRPRGRRGSPRPEPGALARPIALVGFHGAGKRTVGRRLAERLNIGFVDLDELMARQTGKTMMQLFREHGQVGLRAHERSALRVLLASAEPVVLATGGGTFIDSSMRQWLREAAHTVYLKAAPEVLVQRIGQGAAAAARPMLTGPDPVMTIGKQLAQQAPAYEQAATTITTDNLGVEDVVEHICRAVGMQARVADEGPVARGGPPAEVPAGGGQPLWIESRVDRYPVHLRDDVGPWLAEHVAEACDGGRVAILSDAAAARQHADSLAADVQVLGKHAAVLPIDCGAGAQSLETCVGLYARLDDVGVRPGDVIVALGGSAVHNVAGFLAATYRQGLALVCVPTSTWAAAGYCGNAAARLHVAGRRELVGCRAAPRVVLVALPHLRSQGPRGHAVGLVRCLSRALAADGELVRFMYDETPALLRGEGHALAPLVRRMLQLRAEAPHVDRKSALAPRYVPGEITESILAAACPTLSRREVEGIGLLIEVELCEREGWAVDVLAPLRRWLGALGFPTQWRPLPVDTDKLRAEQARWGEVLPLPVITEPGRARTREVPYATLTRYLSIGRVS